MSQAFVKEGDASDDPPERPVSDRPNYVTPRGLAALKSQAEDLARRRTALISRQDEPAVAERKLIDRDLRYVEARLNAAILVDRSADPPPEVRFGACVEAKENGVLQKFVIVGEDEADPAGGKISWCSPLAMALMGAQAGDEISLEDTASAGAPRQFTVVTVAYPK